MNSVVMETLWDTVPQDSLPPLSAPWLEEMQRRSLEYEANAVPAVPWEEIRSDALRRIGRSLG